MLYCVYKKARLGAGQKMNSKVQLSDENISIGGAVRDTVTTMLTHTEAGCY